MLIKGKSVFITDIHESLKFESSFDVQNHDCNPNEFGTLVNAKRLSLFFNV